MTTVRDAMAFYKMYSAFEQMADYVAATRIRKYDNDDALWEYLELQGYSAYETEVWG